MPSAASLTVKKNDGTTDVTFTLLAASGGDKSPAVWRSTSAPGTGGQQPLLQVSSRPNGDNTARRVDMTYVYPSTYTDANTGLTQIRSKVVAQLSVAVPLDIVTADANEAGAQLAHLLNSTLLVSVLQGGYAPT